MNPKPLRSAAASLAVLVAVSAGVACRGDADEPGDDVTSASGSPDELGEPPLERPSETKSAQLPPLGKDAEEAPWSNGAAPAPADEPDAGVVEVETENGPVSAQRALAERLGLPPRFAIGLGNDLYDGGGADRAAGYALGTKLDIHYMYLSGLGWPSWTASPGDYVTAHATAARSRGIVPMFTLYQAAAWGEANLASFADASFMTSYWRNARTMFEKLGAFGDPAIVHLEPDFWGYAQKQGGDDPSAVSVRVASLVPECADLPGNVAGFGACLVRLARLLSPKVIVGLSASTFGAHTSGVPDAGRVGAYLAAVAADADLVVVETLDRDAGCFERAADPSCQRKGSFYWDETNTTHPSFHDHLAWAKALHQRVGKPLLWWQMPLGVPGDAAGSAGRYRDNRVRYLFAHPDEFVAAGGIGAVFGTGAPNQTTLETDNGQFDRALAAYAASPVALP